MNSFVLLPWSPASVGNLILLLLLGHLGFSLISCHHPPGPDLPEQLDKESDRNHSFNLFCKKLFKKIFIFLSEGLIKFKKYSLKRNSSQFIQKNYSFFENWRIGQGYPVVLLSCFCISYCHIPFKRC